MTDHRNIIKQFQNFKLVRHTGWKSTVPEVRKEAIVAVAGTKVICPKCRTTIGRLYSDLYSGVSCRADQIEFEQGQKRHPNELAECKRCGEGYMKQHLSVQQGTRIMIFVELPGGARWI